MTAFLILPATPGSGAPRRLNLADFGSLFAEVEEPARAHFTAFSARRVLSVLVILLLMLCDTALLARPQSVASPLFRSLHATIAPA